MKIGGQKESQAFCVLGFPSKRTREVIGLDIHVTARNYRSNSARPTTTISSQTKAATSLKMFLNILILQTECVIF